MTLEQRHLDKKWEAMQAYKSQIAKGLPYFTPEFIWSGDIYSETRYPEILSRLGLRISRFRRFL